MSASGTRRVGLWAVGALGAVSTLVAAGVEAMKAGLAGPAGLVTSAPDFDGLGLVEPGELVVGGHEIRGGDYAASAEEFARANGVLSRELLDAVRPGLLAASANLRPGLAINCGEAIRKLAPLASDRENFPLTDGIAAIQGDLRQFQSRNRLDEVIVVHLASAEPGELDPTIRTHDDLHSRILENRKEGIPASSLYAWAAMDAGYPYVNFTSSTGSSHAALEELAKRRGVPHGGRDGKTGETLLKTVLAPMFVARRLKVLSWEGHNLLGNRDGQVLENPANLAAKAKDKEAALRELLGDPGTHSGVRIDYVPSLGDWKTAWDFIHFEGYLGARMSLQFTWQGCDSALAAPLVLDLVRLADLAHRLGESGGMRHLGAFFKAPWQAATHDFHAQMDELAGYASARRARVGVGR